MPIQIVGLRPYVHTKTGRLKKRTVFFEKGWRVDKIEDIFKDTAYLGPIPEEDRVNLYFTMADCFEAGKPRILKESWCIGFDIDSLGLDSPADQDKITAHCRKILDISCQELSVDVSKVGAIFSGNGLQFFIRLPSPIMSVDFYDTMREQYNIVCAKLQARLKLEHIAGKVDTSVFDGARLMRLPNTWNEKPEKGRKWAFIVQSNMEPQEFRLEEITGDAAVAKADTMNKESWKKYPTPDKKGVLAGCDYLKWMKEKPNDVSEEQWYAGIGILAFLPDGENLTHEYSSGYKGYDPQETEEKYNQALRTSGPRLCKDISKRWSKCKGCAYYNVVTTPIQIKSADYIATKDTGFRKPSFTNDGKPKPGKVEYQDLIKQFLFDFEYAKVDQNGMYIYDAPAKKWIEYSQNRMRAWCNEKVFPKPMSSEMYEFVNLMSVVNLKPKDWLDGSDNRHINFNNGVLDRETMELKVHSAEYGFKYVLPFDYSPHAKAPVFENYLETVTGGDKQAQQLLKEFGGYCLSGDEYKYHGALLLVGTGENGKSVFIETLARLAGEENVSVVAMSDLSKEVNRHAIVNKLYNYSEENGATALLNSDIFKKLSSGGVVQVKHLYEQPFNYRNKTKLILSCNELPINRDHTHAMTRRMLPVAFNQVFTDANRNVNMKKDLLKEASGIYNILLAAYKELDKRERFSLPDKSREILTQYNMEQDPVFAFFKEMLEFGIDYSVSSQELYTNFMTYYEQNNYEKNKCPSQNTFGRKMKSHNPLFDRDNQKLVRVNGKVTRCYVGVRMKEEAEF